MRMSHLYQPLMLRTLIEKGGFASLRDIASSFLMHDESQIEYYVEITKRMPVPVFTRHRASQGFLGGDVASAIRFVCVRLF
jgi:ATP adenylyltransferase